MDQGAIQYFERGRKRQKHERDNQPPRRRHWRHCAATSEVQGGMLAALQHHSWKCREASGIVREGESGNKLRRQSNSKEVALAALHCQSRSAGRHPALLEREKAVKKSKKQSTSKEAALAALRCHIQKCR